MRNAELNCAGRRDRKADSPARGPQPDERRHRERYHHREAEIRQRDMTASPVVVLVEEAEARREDEQANGDHGALHPPGFSQSAASQGDHRRRLMHRRCQSSHQRSMDARESLPVERPADNIVEHLDDSVESARIVQSRASHKYPV